MINIKNQKKSMFMKYYLQMLLNYSSYCRFNEKTFI